MWNNGGLIRTMGCAVSNFRPSSFEGVVSASFGDDDQCADVYLDFATNYNLNNLTLDWYYSVDGDTDANPLNYLGSGQNVQVSAPTESTCYDLLFYLVVTDALGGEVSMSGITLSGVSCLTNPWCGETISTARTNVADGLFSDVPTGNYGEINVTNYQYFTLYGELLGISKVPLPITSFRTGRSRIIVEVAKKGVETSVRKMFVR